MKSITILLLLTALFTTSLAANWAVLVAGSNQFYNYRHQADVFHAYQTLLKKGMSKDNIIVMAYDDIASSTSNPIRGKVFNKPTYADAGVDVYDGINIDYKGNDVTPAVFLNVLLGNKTFVKGRGTERVLQSTSKDNVFIFFSDHGSTNLIAFPSEYLYADQLITTLNQMKGSYNKLVFYLETCESGSMFVNLPKNTQMYALSASGTDESSWATYCPPDDVIQGKHLNTCLGDLFSINFLEDIDNNDVSTQTLDIQFQRVKDLTTLSYVMQWGDTSFVQAKVSDFIGNSANLRNPLKIKIGQMKKKKFASILTYNVKINYLTNAYRLDKSQHNLKMMMEQMRSMQRMDNLFFLIKQENKLTGYHDKSTTDYDCYRKSIQIFEGKCGKITQYGYQYMKYLAENCQSGSTEGIQKIVKKHC